MIKIYQGPTGCGKTYQAFNRLNKKAKAIYLAPCRQLVYESAMKYGNNHSHISTSDIKIGDANRAKLSFRTYEACQTSDLKDVDVLIIDEAHFMADPERGSHLVSLVHYMDQHKRSVVLLSATMSFKVAGAKIITLPSRGQQFKKVEIPYKEALDRAKAGIPTLVFHKRRSDCGDVAWSLGIKGAAITAETSVQDRIRLVNLFNEGKITILEATNAMAQGVNVPCENLIMMHNSYDGAETIVQKMGRLGRTGVTREGVALTYCYCDGETGRQYDAQERISRAKRIIKSEQKSEKINPHVSTGKSTCRDRDLLNPASPLDKIKTTNLIKRSWRHE